MDFFNRLCVDIGSSKIKIIYGRNFGGKLIIYKSEIIDTPFNSFTNGYINNKYEIAERIKSFIKANKIIAPQISFVVHSSDILIRTIKLPIMSRNNILKSIEWELGNYTKGAKIEYYIEYATQRKNQLKPQSRRNGNVMEDKHRQEQEQEQQKGNALENFKVYLKEKVKEYLSRNKLLKVVYVAVPKIIVNQYETLAMLIGARIKHIEIASICAARFLHGRSKNYFIMDFGYESTRISLYEGSFIFADRELLFKKPNNFQGAAITTKDSTNAIFANNSLNTNLEDVFKNFSQITNYYLSIDVNHSISGIYTSGGLAYDTRVCELVESISLSSSNAITDFKKIQADDKLKENINMYTNVIGLLLRK